MRRIVCRKWFAYKILGVLGLLIFASGSRAYLGEETYVCLAYRSAGFSLDATETWVVREFDVNNEEHILRSKANRWEWVKPGEANGVVCPPFDRSGYMQCNYGYGSLFISKRTMRYIETYTVGYVEGNKKSANPSITLGECTLI